MKLVIVESPAKAKTIEKYLKDIDSANDFVVRASVGHVRDLPKSNKKAIDIPGGFVPHYEVVANKMEVIANLKTLAKRADEVILATDPDREGEAIAWHIAEELKLKKPERIVFHEITKEAIAEALAHPRKIDDNLRFAQEARRVLDRLVGYDLSGLIWKKVRYGLSAGRVQSPALRIIMEREREIRAFIPEDYWVISADVKNKTGIGFTVVCEDEPRDKKVVDDILAKGNKGDWFVVDVKETEVSRKPNAPFTTSTLQQTASSRLGFAPSRTMGVAQKLYEAGHITYMRTDSTNLGVQAHADIEKTVTKQFGAEMYSRQDYKTKSKNAQEAHEAIRPTHAASLKAGANDDQKKLYQLIWQRTVASQMIDAKMLRTKVLTNIKGETIPNFSINGSRVLVQGWLAADPDARGEDTEVPKVIADEALDLVEMHDEAKQTQPPARYSEAGLIKELEKRGIGRPSTYASIMKTLADRGYVLKEGRSLIPTDTGDVVSTFLEDNFADYISDTFTADMEDQLDDIAEGKREYAKTLKEFYTPFLKVVKERDKVAGKITDLGPAPAEFTCPICGSPMVFKLSRQGKFMSCERFPDCTGARTEVGDVISDEPPPPVGVYPETGENIYILTGRFGPYVQVGAPVKKVPKVKGAKKAPALAKPHRASLPKGKEPTEVTLEEALKYLSLPRTLGTHPETGENIIANVGRFGPYIAHTTKPKPDFRSLKTDDVYKITLQRALEILKEEKKKRGFARKAKAE
ncbi:MAG: topA [Candidatus Adlerbacteria bacterium]|nr:topA [Candidatus Adlerbacteria bacterium]